jgi:hypothetical protein
MLLNHNVVIMSFPQNLNTLERFHLAVGATAVKRDVYVSAGYELETSEQSSSTTDGHPEFDPILFFSQNSHLICEDILITTDPSSGPQAVSSKYSRQNLFLFPDFPWIKFDHCTRVRLMKRRTPSFSPVPPTEFSPTGLYEIMARPHHMVRRYNQGPEEFTLDPQGSQSQSQSPSQKRHDVFDTREEPMYFTVLCRSKDRCGSHGRVIMVDEVSHHPTKYPMILTISSVDISMFQTQPI